MNLAVFGANGRMGNALIEALTRHEEMALSAAFVRENHPLIGQRVSQQVADFHGEIRFTAVEQLQLRDVDVVIDFTLPEALESHLSLCVAAKKPVVIGTTGLDGAQKDILQQAANLIPIVFAANYSVGVTLMLKLCRMGASVLADSADIEIIEAHHRHKLDSPSGTALALGEAIAEAAGRDLSNDAIYGRQGNTGERNQRTIGFSTIRGGDIIGEHTALFADIGERLEITHKASSRQTFAQGALRAARWLPSQPNGLYDMEDVLSLRR